MDRIDRSGTGIASLGRDEDQFLAHVALGERVVPPVISASTQARINQEMRAAGLDPNEYAVGSGMSINPITGLPEFGFLKKAFKSIKKVAKKVAPVAMLIPGVGTALGGVLGGIGGGLGSLVSSIPGVGGALSSVGSAVSGIGKFFNPIKGATGMFGGTIGPSIRSGIGSIFGGGLQPYTDAEVDTMLETMDPSVVEQMVNERNSQIGSFFGRKTPDFIKGIEDTLKGETGAGSNGLFSGIGSMAGGFPGGGLGIGLTGLLAKAVYDDTKSKSGGLAQTPQVMMDSLGRYQLSKELGTGGTRGEFGLGPKPAVLNVAGGGEIQRQMFSVGGVAELDLREGGESIGPGTGTSDDIPAMLSDGEFVMTAKATRGAGAYDLKKGKSGIELIQGGNASREKGVENMRELMNIFEGM